MLQANCSRRFRKCLTVEGDGGNRQLSMMKNGNKHFSNPVDAKSPKTNRVKFVSIWKFVNMQKPEK